MAAAVVVGGVAEGWPLPEAVAGAGFDAQAASSVAAAMSEVACAARANSRENFLNIGMLVGGLEGKTKL